MELGCVGVGAAVFFWFRRAFVRFLSLTHSLRVCVSELAESRNVRPERYISISERDEIKRTMDRFVCLCVFFDTRGCCAMADTVLLLLSPVGVLP